MPQVVVITGASGGIGESIALAIHKAAPQQYVYALIARRESELQRVAASLEGETTLTIVADVTVRANVDAAAAQIVDKFGTIDIWINNAGRGCNVVPSKLTDEILDDMVTINVKTLIYGYQAALKVMKEKNGGKGQIINVTSMLAFIAVFDPKEDISACSAYSAAKAFAHQFTEMMRQEADHDELTKGKLVVTEVIPGPVATDFGNNSGLSDNRDIPNVQSVEEAGEVIYQQAIAARKKVAYTREVYQTVVGGYYTKFGSE